MTFAVFIVFYCLILGLPFNSRYAETELLTMPSRTTPEVKVALLQIKTGSELSDCFNKTLDKR